LNEKIFEVANENRDLKLEIKRIREVIDDYAERHRLHKAFKEKKKSDRSLQSLIFRELKPFVEGEIGNDEKSAKSVILKVAELLRKSICK
jgi:regulator of replication initiation timing